MKTVNFDAQTFADVPRSSWSFPYIEQLAATGQIQGEDVQGLHYYYPNRNITRVEAAAIINRNKALTGAPIKDIFRDFKQIPDWGRDAVTQLWNDHWISGYEDGNFYPFRTLTRAEAAKLLANLPTQEK
ncbi:S-layer homology domain-containing protein [Paenibacillus sp. yr247]|uniref:S-layer homology domain-containing protein n=1 Tax=Paenibacillus sp. yr247 TaxID=1761880 RepID=UPI0034A4B5D6